MRKRSIFIFSFLLIPFLAIGQGKNMRSIGIDYFKLLTLPPAEDPDKYTKLEGFFTFGIYRPLSVSIKVGYSNLKNEINDSFVIEQNGYYIKPQLMSDFYNQGKVNLFIFGGLAGSFNQFQFSKKFGNRFDQTIIYKTRRQNFIIVFPEIGIKNRFNVGRFFLDCDFSLRYLDNQKLFDRYTINPLHVSGFGSLESKVVPAFQMYGVLKF